MSEGKFRLDVALEKAWDEYLGLKDEERSPVQLMGLARRYAPKTISDCLATLEENKWLFWIDAQEGMLLQDVIVATVTSWMFRALLQKEQDYQQNKIAKTVRSQIQRSKR